MYIFLQVEFLIELNFIGFHLLKDFLCYLSTKAIIYEDKLSNNENKDSYIPLLLLSNNFFRNLKSLDLIKNSRKNISR